MSCRPPVGGRTARLLFVSCRHARQGDAHCRRTNEIMQQDPPPSRAPREPIPWAAEPAFICAWPPQGGTSVPAPWSKPGPGHGNPTGPIPCARAGHAQTGAATPGGRVSRHPGLHPLAFLVCHPYRSLRQGRPCLTEGLPKLSPEKQIQNLELESSKAYAVCSSMLIAPASLPVGHKCYRSSQ